MSENIVETSLQGVVSLGVDMFAEALAEQGVTVTRVDWRPPMDVAADASLLLGDLED